MTAQFNLCGVNLTPNEKGLMLAIYNDEYSDGTLDCRPWSWSPCGTKSKAGVLSSLVEKDICFTDDAQGEGKKKDYVVGFTALGKEIVQAILDEKNEPEEQTVAKAKVKVAEVKPEETPAYKAGYDAASTSLAKGAKASSPSRSQRTKWESDWVNFLAGWKQAATDYKSKATKFEDQTDEQEAEGEATPEDEITAEAEVVEESSSDETGTEATEDADQAEAVVDVEAGESSEGSGVVAEEAVVPEAKSKRKVKKSGATPVAEEGEHVVGELTPENATTHAGTPAEEEPKKKTGRKPITTTPEEVEGLIPRAADRDAYIESLTNISPDGSAPLNLEVRHLIERAGGIIRVYSKRMCSNSKCKADADNITPYLMTDGIEDKKLGEIPGRYVADVCGKCGSVRSWVWRGIKPEGWKDFTPPKSREYQRDKVYQWQSGTIGKEAVSAVQLDEADARSLVKVLCDSYSMPQIEVRIGKGGKCWMRGSATMSLVDSWGFKPWVILHEFGHAVMSQLSRRELIEDSDPTHHGALYCAVLAHLMEEFDFCDDAEALCEGMRSEGLKVEDLANTRLKIKALKKANKQNKPITEEENEEVVEGR